MHPPRDDFIATMSGAERAAFDAHAAWLRRLLADGLLIAAGRAWARSTPASRFSRQPARVKRNGLSPANR